MLFKCVVLLVFANTVLSNIPHSRGVSETVDANKLHKLMKTEFIENLSEPESPTTVDISTDEISLSGPESTTTDEIYTKEIASPEANVAKLDILILSKPGTGEQAKNPITNELESTDT